MKTKAIKKRSLFHKIVNGFLAVLIGIVFFLLLFFGFSQTKTFRELLRTNAITLINNELYGKINIGRIDGTIFTSLYVRDISLTVEGDTFACVKKIELQTRLHKLLFKEIYVKKLMLSDVRLSMLQGADGKWNYEKIAKPTPVDTTTSHFPYTIRLARLELLNADILRKTFANLRRNEVYQNLNFDDVFLKGINLVISGRANIEEKDFYLKLEEFSASPNIANLKLHDFSGNFHLNKNGIKIENVNLATERSAARLALSWDKLNVFKGFDIQKIKNIPLDLKLDISRFSFDDLASINPSLGFLRGTVSGGIKAYGTLSELNIQNLLLYYGKTKLALKGTLFRLNDPKSMAISAEIHDSQFFESDVCDLLPESKIPRYSGLNLSAINIKFDGSPTQFNATIGALMGDGKIAAKTGLNFSSPKIKYEADIEVSRINLQAFFNMPTNINAIASISGEGIDPKDLNASGEIKLVNSTFGKYSLDTLKCEASSVNSSVAMKMNAAAAGAICALDVHADLKDMNNPVYTSFGKVKNLDLRKIQNDSSASYSNLNFNFDVKGKSFDLNKMDVTANVLLLPSEINKVKLDSSLIAVRYFKDNDEKRTFSLNSDFLDFSMAGNYNIQDVINAAVYQSGNISKAMMTELNDFNPNLAARADIKEKISKIAIKTKQKVELNMVPNFSLNYKMTAKNLKAISLMAGAEDITVKGEVSGEIRNSRTLGFEFTNEMKIENLKYVSSKNNYYVSNLLLKFSLDNENLNSTFDKIRAKGSLKIDRVFSGTDIKNFNMNIELKNSKLNLSASSSIDTVASFNLDGSVAVAGREISIVFSKLKLEYKKIPIENDGPIEAVYTSDLFDLKRFKLKKGTSAIDMAGSLYSDGKENFRLQITDLDAELLTRFLGKKKEEFNTRLNATVLIGGELKNPVIKVDLGIDDIVYNKVKFGFIDCKLDYLNKMLDLRLNMLDSTYNKSKPVVLFTGKVPVDLSFTPVEKRISDNAPLALNLKSENLDLGIFGDLFPYVKKIKGRLSADVSFGGSLDEPVYDGYLKASGMSFLLTNNNMQYNLDGNISLSKHDVLIDYITVRNSADSKYKGSMTGSGNIKLAGYNLSSIDMKLDGDLAVLAMESKTAIPMVYGNLVIQSDGSSFFNYANGVSKFTGTILLKNTNLVFPPSQSVYNNASAKNFVYRYTIDSTKIDKKKADFEKFVSLSQTYSSYRKVKSNQTSSGDFRYNVRIKILDEAKISFIMEPRANQKLNAILNGDLILESGGMAQGEFSLLDGSTLDFVRTLNATGTLRFESDITNPSLNIVAVYNGTTSDSTNTDVQVRIKLTGNVSDLGHNFAKSEDNISVYIGATNISNNIKDGTKDAADAVSFIMIGKFVSELTAGDKNAIAGTQNQLLQNAATSVLGSVLSKFANEQLGDVIQNIDLKQNVRNETRFSLSGRIGGIRYSIGGTTEAFQDPKKATLKLEYPFTESFLMRLERKDPVIENSANTDKINELGLKYRYQF